MTKKRMLTFFGVILVALLSVCCVFSVACKKDKHEHDYSKYDYDDDSHWTYCPDDDEKDESSVTGHDWTESGTTEATCIAYGTTSYTCVCGATKTVTEEEAGYADHKYEVVFTWAEDYTSASAAYVCSVCGDEDTETVLEVSVTPKTADNGDVTYTATATLNGETVGTDEKVVEADTSETEYTITLTGATEASDGTYSLALAITGVKGGEDEAFGSATLGAALYADDSEVTDATPTWKSGSETIATVTDAGLVTAVAAGTATVTVTYYGEDGATVLATESIVVTVTDSRTETSNPGTAEPSYSVTVSVSGTELTASENSAYDYALSLDITDGNDGGEDVYGSATLTAALYADGTAVEGATVDWSVAADGSAIVKIDNGTVTADAEGETVVTVTFYDTTDTTKVLASATIVVTVTDSREPVATERETVTAPTGTITWEEVEWTPNAGITISGPTTDETEGTVTYTYTVSGAASAMETQEQADAYWKGTAQIGDLYVYLEVVVQPGETITWSNGAKSYTVDANATTYEIGEFIIGIYGGKSWSFTISSGEESEAVSTTYVVDFSGITNLITTADQLTAALAASGTYTLGANIEGSFTVAANVNVVLNLGSYTISTATTLETATDTITVEEGASLTINGSTGSIKNTYETGTSTNNAAAIYTKGTVVINGGVVESSSVGIRAQGGTVTINGGKISTDFYAIWEDVGVVTITINGGEIYGSRKGIYVGGDADFGLSGYQTGAMTTLIINDGTITCKDDSAICTLGYTSVDSAYIEINGGTITSNYLDDTTAGNGGSSSRIPAIYLPGGTLKVTGGTISGATALEVRGGSVTITGGTFGTTANVQNNPTYQSSGATSYGYAVAVYPFGKTNGRYKSDDTYDTSTTVTISGGTFNGEIYGTKDTTYTKNGQEYDLIYTLEITITGGTFSADPSEYVPGLGYTLSGDDSNGYTVEPVTPINTDLVSITELVCDSDSDFYVEGATGTPSDKENSDLTMPLISSDAVLYEGEDGTTITVKTTGKKDETVSVDYNNKKIDNNNFYYRLKLEGAGSETYRSIELDVVGACTVTVYMMSSSSNKDEDEDGEIDSYGNRTVYLYGSDCETIVDGYVFDEGDIENYPGVNGESIGCYTFEITEAGTYYLASLTGGVNIYGIIITYTVEDSVEG